MQSRYQQSEVEHMRLVWPVPVPSGTGERELILSSEGTDGRGDLRPSS
jgi:hypothetical protein